MEDYNSNICKIEDISEEDLNNVADTGVRAGRTNNNNISDIPTWEKKTYQYPKD